MRCRIYGRGFLLGFVPVPFSRRKVKVSGWAFVILVYRYSSVWYKLYLLSASLQPHFQPFSSFATSVSLQLFTLFDVFAEGEIIFILSFSPSSISKKLHSSPSELAVLLS